MSPTPSPGDKKNIVKMAYIYFQEGRWDKAIEEYKKLLQLDPGDVNTHNMLGDVYVKKGSHREAFEAYSKVSTEFSSHGQTDKAVIVNKKIAALDTGALPAEAQKKQHLLRQALKAETAMEQGNVDEAIEALNEVSKLDSENLGAYAKLGELLEKKGKIPEAIQQYQVLGAVFLKNRLFKKAQEIFQRVTLLDPNNQEAHNALAQIFVKQGSESDAKKEFLAAAELAVAAGDLEKAEGYAAKAVEFKSIEAHYILGMVLFKRQKMSEAKNEFESLLRFKVNHVGALTHLGRVLLELGQADKAAEQIQKALKIEKDNPTALEGMVELCLKKGNKAEAATHLTALIDRLAVKDELVRACEFAANLVSLDENNPASNAKLADLLSRSGNKVEAADAFFKTALAYEKAGKKDQEKEALKKALDLNPGHPGAQKKVMGEVTASSVPPPAPAKPAASPAAAASAPVTAASIGKIPAAGVLDLDDDLKASAASPKPAAAPVPERPKPAPAPVAEAPGGDEDLASQMSIADGYLSQGLVQEAIEIYQQLAEVHPDNDQVKKKLNQAYTAYVKTGDEVLGALEREKKAKEEEEGRIKQEMERKAQEESKRLQAEMEVKVRAEAEAKARVEAEAKARVEAEKKVHEEAERRVREENDRKVREESEKKVQEDAYRRAKEEAEVRVREELHKKAEEDARRKTADEIKTSRVPPPSKGDSLEEGRDEFMTIAVADIYVRQGLKEEALKIYRRIVQADPGNLEAKKKLSDLEATMKPSTPPASAPTPAAPPAKTPPPHDGDKDSGGKKRPNRVGYV